MERCSKCSLGLDFGTESVRALLVDLAGLERGVAVVRYPRGQIIDALPTAPHIRLPANYALQHPQDWLDCAAKAVQEVRRESGVDSEQIIGIGVDFTSCTMLPCLADGTPLCLIDSFSQQPLAWPKLWKHHAAKSQAIRINAVMTQRDARLLDRYGGAVGLEWFFPKVLETLENDSRVSDATDVWLEAGDWFVWRLVGCSVDVLPRSTCQAGYKAMWSPEEGYPSAELLGEIHPELAKAMVLKMPGRFVIPGNRAGELSAEMANLFGLRAGTPVSAAIIDAHAGVYGAGAATPGILVMVMGTSSCYMLNATQNRPVPGVAGVVKDGILPGYYGYETGQAAVGDAFDWLRRLLGQEKHADLTQQAAELPPGAAGVRALDWMNGCRTPLMDGRLRGAFTGLTLQHTGAHLYRALIEASGYGLRWIVEIMREGGLPVEEFIATGGLPHQNPLVVQIYADLLGEQISVPATRYGPALGAAILGMLAAGNEKSGFSSSVEAIQAMANSGPDETARHVRTFVPNKTHQHIYDSAYRDYRDLAKYINSSERIDNEK